ncbi:hypothetical protein TrRE_jg4272 [Triparma retinervis]|uniref:Uncharacterized protein n=1 Tax=Triparma retinervis TaxID=2557542 RepID=A0A9W6ZB61_9STRA|nr:hypothetical protein TrRE_jg4272 [Triparma retinervis]
MKSTALLLLPCAAATLASSASSSVTVFSTHPNTLHIQGSLAGQSVAQSEIIANSLASDVVSSLSGAYAGGPSGGPVPAAVDVFTRPDYNLILSLPPASDLLSAAPEGSHDAKTWVLESESLPVGVPALSGGLCAGPPPAKDFCPSGVSSHIANASPVDAAVYLADMGVPSTYDAETGVLSIDGAALSFEGKKEVKELVGLISHLKSKKDGRKKRACDSPLPTNLYVSSSSPSPALSTALQALVPDLLSVLSSRRCGSTVTVIKAPSPSSPRLLAAASASVSAKEHCALGGCNNTASSGYSDDYINNYSISLWVTVSLVAVVLAMMAATGGMTMNMDPILLANFKADLGDGKYD